MATTPLISIEEIQEEASTPWSEPQLARATQILEGTLSRALRLAPCLKDANFVGRDEARMIISEAVLRAVAGDPATATYQTAGPFAAQYPDRSAKPALTRADEEQLRGLCPQYKPVKSIHLKVC